VATPKLGKKITIATLLKEFEQLRRAVRLALDKSYQPREVVDIKQFIRQLKEKGASTAKRHKSIAYALDADNIQFYI
jgi:type VI protein secretion system component VasF